MWACVCGGWIEWVCGCGGVEFLFSHQSGPFWFAQTSWTGYHPRMAGNRPIGCRAQRHTPTYPLGMSMAPYEALQVTSNQVFPQNLGEGISIPYYSGYHVFRFKGINFHGKTIKSFRRFLQNSSLICSMHAFDILNSEEGGGYVKLICTVITASVILVRQ